MFIRKYLITLLTIIIFILPLFIFAASPKNSVAILDLTPRHTAKLSDFESVEHICNAMGLPYDVVLTADEITSHPLTLIACTYNLNYMYNAERATLKKYVNDGGWLFASDVSSESNLYDLFGLSAAAKTSSLYRITFDTTIDDPSFAFIDYPYEQTISLGNPEYPEVIQSRQYQLSTGEALGHFENNDIAYVRNFYGSGRTYTIGVTFSDIIQRDQENKDYDANRVYTGSAVEATGDILMLMIRSIYEEIVDVPLIKHTIPESHKSALIITHDIDAKDSYANAIKFCQLEEPFGYHSTFFIETKYFQDYLDGIIYNEDSIASLNTVKQFGNEMGSHSVGHFPDFDKFPVGDPDVTYPEYQPYNNGISTTGGTIYGETKISKYLLDRDLGLNVTAFRAGYLLFPEDLPEVLDACGYLYDASNHANEVLQSYPYFLTVGNQIEGAFTNVLEIPLCLSDHDLNVDTVTTVVQSWHDDLMVRYNNFSPNVLLIHPTNLNEKITAETDFLNEISDLGLDLWKGNLTTYGKFWRNRLAMKYDWDEIGSTLNIYITSTLSEPYTPLVFKDKGLISEINLYYQPDGEPAPVKLEYEQSTKYGYVFILPVMDYKGLDVKEWALY